jgi:protein gp37
MRDLFQDSVSFQEVEQMVSAMLITPQYTYQIVTAHAERMKNHFQDRNNGPILNIMLGCIIKRQQDWSDQARHLNQLHETGWRTFYLLEPLLEPVNLHLRQYPVNWVVVGGEVGNEARAFYVDWATELIQQCVFAQVPIFIKQLGSNVWEGDQAAAPHEASGRSHRKQEFKDPDGANPTEWPVSLQVRQRFPLKPY